MKETRLNNTLRNAYTGGIMRMITLLISFVSRTIFIKFLGNECLGINGVFTSVFQMLSLAELGIGEAITYYLYKPIAENDQRLLSSLIAFYRFCYRIIGGAILLLGLCVMPFMKNIINLEQEIPYNINILFALYLLNTAIPYLFFSYPQTVLIAHQKQYIVNRVSTIFTFVGLGLDIIAIVVFKNFIVYISLRLFGAVARNIVLAVIAAKRYPFIRCKDAEKIEKPRLKEMFSDVYSIFVVKVASQLFTSTDNIIISVLLGTELVGINSNYVMITTSVMGFLSTFIYACAASVGNVFATESRETTENLFSIVDFITFCFSFVVVTCFYSLVNPFIELMWGSSYVLSPFSVILISSNFYIPISLYALFCFRQSMGLFKAYRYNQLFAAIVNITLDIILGKWIGLNGIFIATTVANLSLTVVPFVKNLYEAGFNSPYKQYAIKWFLRYFITMGVCLLLSLVNSIFNGSVGSFVLLAVTSVVIVGAILWVISFRTKEYQSTLLYFKRVLKSQLAGRKRQEKQEQ